MKFEFDPVKSLTNRDKHGIDFEQAQAVWDDSHLITAPARTVDEPRWLAVGRIGRRIWSVVYTLRGGAVRIISARRARENEVKAYESSDIR